MNPAMLTDEAVYRHQGYGKARRTTNLGLSTRDLDQMLALPGVPQQGMLLEVGCGDGNGTVHLARRKFDVVGIDICPEAIDMAENFLRDSGVSNVRLICSDAADLAKVHDGCFDCIIDSCCFHCVTDLSHRKRFLSRMYGLLKNSGCFLGRSICQPTMEILRPHADDVYLLGQIAMRRIGPETDFIPFRIVRTREQIEQELANAGFTVRWQEHRVLNPGFGAHHYTWLAVKGPFMDTGGSAS